MAVLAVAFATTIAVALNYQVFIDIRRTQNLLAGQQSRIYAEAAEAVAMRLLEADREDNDFDGPGDIWMERQPPLVLEDGAVIALRIEDLMGRVNLNAVPPGDTTVGHSPAALFQRLLAGVHPEYQSGVEQALADWIDADTDVTFPGGAEDDYYTRLDSPYRPANTALADTSELRLVRGMDRATWEAVRPFVTALPEEDSRINVNTAPLEVLMALTPEVDRGQAEAVVALREREPFTSPERFRTQFPGFAHPDLPTERLVVASEYFLVVSEVTLDRARVTRYSIVHRPAQGPMRVVRRTGTPP